MKFEMTKSDQKLFVKVYQYENGLMKFKMGQWISKCLNQTNTMSKMGQWS